MDMKVNIRPEQESDRDVIAQIHYQAFGRDEEAKLVDRLRESATPLLSLVAEIDETLVGHFLFSPVTLADDTTTKSFVGLAPMAVLPTWQNRGIDSKLVEA
jgi:putative acetyltransferase